ncbi:MAG: O-antigen ligase family protein, partial [Chloroflexi bacterium]|nr:O-antigen ligase family protein [Chloroflexota bacterium]
MSSTKFSAFCERIMEAGWLLAAISVPLFFDIYSSRVFEPDKLTLLRSIALVVVAAWLAKLIETGSAGGQSGGGSILRRLQTANPFTIPVLLLMAIYIISTLASVAPFVSVWGSYQRLQGTYSTFSYIVIFSAMLHALKTRAQIERLLTVIAITSLPVAAYGWIQHLNRDPLPWGGDVTERIASSMGNSIFVGAYLIMVLPVTLARWINTVQQVLREPVRDAVSLTERATPNGRPGQPVGERPRLILVGCLLALLVFQFVAIYWTFSRGAWIGLLAGMFVFLFLLGVRRHSIRIWGGSLAAAVLGVVFLLVINLPNSPLTAFRSLPGVGRLGTILDTEQGTNKVRFLIWEGAINLISPHDPIGFGQYADSLNFLRPLIGYGPETMYVAYNRFYPPDLAHLEARNASPDRSHNETFDSLVITGLVGFVIYLTLFGSVFYYGFKWLGLGGERRDRYFFILCWVLGGATGAVIAIVVEGSPRLVGVALPVGLLFGLLAYLVAQTLYFKRKQAMPALSDDQIMLMALLGAIVAHFAEIHFGIAIAATRTYFWIYAALLVLIGYRMQQAVPAEAAAPMRQPANQPAGSASLMTMLGQSLVTTEQRVIARFAGFQPIVATVSGSTNGVYLARKRRRDKVATARAAGAVSAQARVSAPLAGGSNDVVIYGLLLGATLMIMIYNFISPSISNSANNIWIVGLFVFTTVVAALIVVAQIQAQSGLASRAMDWINRYLLIVIIALACMAVFAFIHLPRLTPRPNQNALDSIMAISDSITIFYLAFFTLLLVLATVLMRETQSPSVIFREPFLMLVYTVLAVVCAVGIVTTNINSVRADVFYKQGLNFDQTRQFDGSIRMYEEAISLAPDQDFYYLFYGRAFLEKARATADVNQRVQLLETSLRQLLRARELNPLNTDHSANLGRLYRTWAEITQDPVKRQDLLNRSIESYAEAIQLSPHNAQLFNEDGSVYAFMGQFDKALAKYQESL